MKPFKTIDEQIALLRSRNLIINDGAAAKRYLLSNNYYNIINGYSKYFPRTGEKYTMGTTFDEVSQLYLFDRELKQAFFTAIICAESHIKAAFAYRFAESFPNIPYAYLNISCYEPNKTLSVVSTISRLSGILNRQQKYKDTSIYHYITKYNNVPIWVLVNYLDFGELRCMLGASLTGIQNKVAKDMDSFIQDHIPGASVFPPETMISFMANINEVRNVCAHNNRLFDFQCKRDSKYWLPLHNTYSISANSERRDTFSVFLSLQCFLSIVEYGTLHNKTRKLMNYLNNHLKTISTNQILSTLGFPADWFINTKKITY